MTESSVPYVRAAPLPIAPALFAVAIFTSASLVFMVQPMVTKLVLPSLGGSPAVWNTSMVFFQAALLIGYLYAHLLQRVKNLRLQVVIHLALLAMAAIFLPLQVSGALGEPDANRPVLWLLVTLVLSVGAPFAILSATAPLLQAWYAHVRAGHEDGKNPYVLYAASNLGSFLALIAYPVLVEPLLTLSVQRLFWTVGYGVFVALILALGLVVWRSRGNSAISAPALAASAPIPWSEKLIWIAMAAVPSSLMLGVTAHLSTDVASAPFLWVLPLALYLLTFVIAFSRRPIIPLVLTLAFQAASIASIATMIGMSTGHWALFVALHIAAFFLTALMCHQRLAARRPPPDRLTEFFLLLSIGGVLGGVFNALVAPNLFDIVLEYPLVLVLACLVRPWDLSRFSRGEIALFVAGILLAASPPVIFEFMRYYPDFRDLVPVGQRMTMVKVLLGAAAIIAFVLRDRNICLAVIVAISAFSAQHVSRGYEPLMADRSFFGVMRVQITDEPKLGGPVHVLLHGTTIHGAQALSPAFECSATMYYAARGPLGQALQKVQISRPSARIGIVGQGAGAMAAYKRAEDRMTFFEIDPMMDRVSRDPKWFSFISRCAEGPIDTVIGDARLTLSREAPGTYDYLLIDAFSSDSVPTHLLTREAISRYLDLLTPDGLLVLHLSNRNLEITHPVYAAADDLNAAGLHQIYYADPGAAYLAEASTEAVVLARNPEALAELEAGGQWSPLKPTRVRAWTDDYVNLVGALDRHWRGVR